LYSQWKEPPVVDDQSSINNSGPPSRIPPLYVPPEFKSRDGKIYRSRMEFDRAEEEYDINQAIAASLAGDTAIPPLLRSDSSELKGPPRSSPSPNKLSNGHSNTNGGEGSKSDHKGPPLSLSTAVVPYVGESASSATTGNGTHGNGSNDNTNNESKTASLSPPSSSSPTNSNGNGNNRPLSPQEQSLEDERYARRLFEEERRQAEATRQRRMEYKSSADMNNNGHNNNSYHSPVRTGPSRSSRRVSQYSGSEGMDESDDLAGYDGEPGTAVGKQRKKPNPRAAPYKKHGNGNGNGNGHDRSSNRTSERSSSSLNTSPNPSEIDAIVSEADQGSILSSLSSSTGNTKKTLSSVSSDEGAVTSSLSSATFQSNSSLPLSNPSASSTLSPSPSPPSASSPTNGTSESIMNGRPSSPSSLPISLLSSPIPPATSPPSLSAVPPSIATTTATTATTATTTTTTEGTSSRQPFWMTARKKRARDVSPTPSINTNVAADESANTNEGKAIASVVTTDATTLNTSNVPETDEKSSVSSSSTTTTPAMPSLFSKLRGGRFGGRASGSGAVPASVTEMSEGEKARLKQQKKAQLEANIALLKAQQDQKRKSEGKLTEDEEADARLAKEIQSKEADAKLSNSNLSSGNGNGNDAKRSFYDAKRDDRDDDHFQRPRGRPPHQPHYSSQSSMHNYYGAGGSSSADSSDMDLGEGKTTQSGRRIHKPTPYQPGSSGMSHMDKKARNIAFVSESSSSYYSSRNSSSSSSSSYQPGLTHRSNSDGPSLYMGISETAALKHDPEAPVHFMSLQPGVQPCVNHWPKPKPLPITKVKKPTTNGDTNNNNDKMNESDEGQPQTEEVFEVVMDNDGQPITDEKGNHVHCNGITKRYLCGISISKWDQSSTSSSDTKGNNNNESNDVTMATEPGAPMPTASTSTSSSSSTSLSSSPAASSSSSSSSMLSLKSPSPVAAVVAPAPSAAPTAVAAPSLMVVGTSIPLLKSSPSSSPPPRQSSPEIVSQRSPQSNNNNDNLSRNLPTLTETDRVSHMFPCS
jgi:hypothetical protein